MSCSDSWTSSYAISWGPPAGPGPVALNRYTGSHDSLQYAIGGTDKRPRTSRRDDSRMAPPCHGIPDAGVQRPEAYGHAQRSSGWLILSHASVFARSDSACRTHTFSAD